MVSRKLIRLQTGGNLRTIIAQLLLLLISLIAVPIRGLGVRAGPAGTVLRPSSGGFDRPLSAIASFCRLPRTEAINWIAKEER